MSKDFKFLHTADLHLGYQQYGLVERFRDYGDVFLEAAEFGVDEEIDFFLISGDLFDDRNISASTFSQAFNVLEKLKKNDVPVFVIEGNHDKAYYSDGMSWLEALDNQKMVNLINVREKGELDILGDYREFKVNGERVRLFGLKYVGARTGELFSKIKKEIKLVEKERGGADFVLLMMHFGIDNQVEKDLGRGFSYGKVSELEEFVDYLALGHYHLPYSIEDWVYNPGSLEATKSDEASYPKGFYFFNGGEVEFIEVDSNREFKEIKVDLGDYKLRKNLMKDLKKQTKSFPKKDYFKDPIVNVVFKGDLRFKETDLPVDKTKELFSSNALYVNIIKRFDREDINFNDFRKNDQEEIERKVLKKLIERDKPKYVDVSDSISSGLIEVKDMLSEGVDSSEIIDYLVDLREEVVLESNNRENDGGREEWDWKGAYKDVD